MFPQAHIANMVSYLNFYTVMEPGCRDDVGQMVFDPGYIKSLEICISAC